MYHDNYPYRPYREYSSVAVIILLLYFFGWFPGLLVNLLVMLQAALKPDHYEVSGFGCLVALFFVCGIGMPLFIYVALQLL